MRIRVFDLETDGLLEAATRIHCVSYHDMETGENVSMSDYEQIKELLKKKK